MFLVALHKRDKTMTFFCMGRIKLSIFDNRSSSSVNTFYRNKILQTPWKSVMFSIWWNWVEKSLYTSSLPPTHVFNDATLSNHMSNIMTHPHVIWKGYILKYSGIAFFFMESFILLNLQRLKPGRPLFLNKGVSSMNVNFTNAP